MPVSQDATDTETDVEETVSGSEEAPIEGLASVRRSNGTCGFPAFRFHEWLSCALYHGLSFLG